MNRPPLGYDDETVLPKNRLFEIIQQIKAKVESIDSSDLIPLQTQSELDQLFSILLQTLDELKEPSDQYYLCFEDYNRFIYHPTGDGLKLVLRRIDEIQESFED